MTKQISQGLHLMLSSRLRKVCSVPSVCVWMDGAIHLSCSLKADWKKGSLSRAVCAHTSYFSQLTTLLSILTSAASDILAFFSCQEPSFCEWCGYMFVSSLQGICNCHWSVCLDHCLKVSLCWDQTCIFPLRWSWSHDVWNGFKVDWQL